MFLKPLCIAPAPSPARRSGAVLAAALLAGLPLAAAAHTGGDAGAHHGLASSLLDGLLHPFTGLDHLAALLAVGAWSALSARRIWLAPLSFALLMLAGALAASAGLALPGVEPMIAASLLVLGLLLAARQQLPAAAAAALVGGFALFHGAAHGIELAGAPALAGMVAATALLHAAGLGLGWALRERSRWWPRLSGLAVAGLGAALLLA